MVDILNSAWQHSRVAQLTPIVNKYLGGGGEI